MILLRKSQNEAQKTRFILRRTQLSKSFPTHPISSHLAQWLVRYDGLCPHPSATLGSVGKQPQSDHLMPAWRTASNCRPNCHDVLITLQATAGGGWIGWRLCRWLAVNRVFLTHLGTQGDTPTSRSHCVRLTAPVLACPSSLNYTSSPYYMAASRGAKSQGVQTGDLVNIHVAKTSRNFRTPLFGMCATAPCKP